MKTSLLLVLYLVSVDARLALAEPPPPLLKDGSILVTQKNGHKTTFDSNKWKVVPRHAKVKVVKPAPPVVVVEQVMHVVTISEDKYRNAVVIHGGVAPRGLNTRGIVGGLEISPSYGFTFGLSYSRKLTDRVGLMGTYLTNQTGLLGVSVGF